MIYQFDSVRSISEPSFVSNPSRQKQTKPCILVFATVTMILS